MLRCRTKMTRKACEHGRGRCAWLKEVIDLKARTSMFFSVVLCTRSSEEVRRCLVVLECL